MQPPKDGRVFGETPKTAVEKSEQHWSGPLKRVARAPQSNGIGPGREGQRLTATYIDKLLI